MNFDELIKMVIDYAVEYKCTIAESINDVEFDVEFDGPEGGFGLSREDTIRLLNHFGERVEMLVSLSPNGRPYCYHYTDDRIMRDDARIMLEELSA